MMLMWLLLHSLVIIPSATPIYNTECSGYPIANKNELYTPNAAPQQTADLYRHEHSLPIHSTDAGTITPAHNSEKVLMKRSDIRLVFYRPVNYLTPAVIAAQHIRAFFDAVAVQALTVWPHEQPPIPLLTIARGQFQLTLSCLGATIPWSVIASAANRFSEAANHVFPATFDAYYNVGNGGVTLWISFRIIIENSPQQPARLILEGPHQKRDLFPSPPPKSALSTRNPPTSKTPRLQLTRFKSFSILMPSILLAQKLEDFYSIIALKIETGAFSSWVPSRNIVLWLWDFELMITCDKMYVPWSFIQSWVIDMAEASSKQFTGFYEAVVRGEGPLSGLVFLIHMKVKDPPI